MVGKCLQAFHKSKQNGYVCHNLETRSIAILSFPEFA